MKREILCPKCKSGLIGKLGKYPGEGHKFVDGKSKISCFCDQCMAVILPGETCSALSIWSTHNPYFAWESEYIETSEKLKPYCLKCQKVIEVILPQNSSDARAWCKECGEPLHRWVKPK